jgi:hypothetical protein
LLEACFSKQWKISQLAINTLTLAIKRFGVKVIPPKPILQQVAKMFEDSNKGVRDEAQSLMVELFRWLGPAIKPQVDTLRPAQAKELNVAFEALPKGKAVPEKRLRCEQPEEEEEEAGPSGSVQSGGGNDEEEESGGMDAFELADPVEILSKIPPDWFEKLVRIRPPVRCKMP